MRNLGIISGFEVIQRVEKCKDTDFIWPQGTEPEHHLDLALFPYLWLRLDIRCGEPQLTSSCRLRGLVALVDTVLVSLSALLLSS